MQEEADFDMCYFVREFFEPVVIMRPVAGQNIQCTFPESKNCYDVNF